MNVAPEAIYDFWFGGPNRNEFGQSRKAWFVKNATLDAEIQTRFLQTLEVVQRGELPHWLGEPKSCLCLVLLLDQFPRNMFRDTARAFATDAAALDVARFAVAQGYDQLLPAVERIFFYLPFEHSEALDDQERCVALVQALVNADASRADFLDYAQRHRAVIERFGRFPHRNQTLGRVSTAAEIEFLRQPGSSF